MRSVNKIILLLVVTVFAIAMCTAVRAQENDTCVSIAKIGRAVMKSRQAGIPMEEVYAIATLPQTKYMVVEAYKIPRFKTPEFVQSETDEFAARMMGKCLEGEL